MRLLKDKRFFIIEDKPNNFAIAKTLLEQQGGVVAFDRYGDQTLQRLRQFGAVDLILLDLMFPNNLTGYDLFDMIRALPEYAQTPVLAVSASDPAVAIPKTQAKGFAGFIAKPISYEHFARQIAQVLNHESVWLAG